MTNTARLARLLRDRCGNVAVFTALAMLPLSVAGLGAADLASAVSGKVQLQDALDSAALAAARSSARTDAELQTVGERYLRQNLRLSPTFDLAGSTFRYGDQGRVLASASVSFEPLVGQLISSDHVTVAADAEVVRADVRLEIALVLDNTGSMVQNGSPKLSRLKIAAKNFVTFMEQAAARSTEPDAVRIALVPFSHAVNVGTTYRYESWLDQDGSSPINDQIFTTGSSGAQHANRFDLLANLGTSWAGCVESRRAPFDISDAAPTGGPRLFTPYFWPDEPDSDDYENNYLTDPAATHWKARQGAIAKYVRTSNLGTDRGPNKGCSLRPLRRLGTDFRGLRSAIDNLNAEGSTNIPLGLVWAWHTLSPNAPFADGADYGTAKLRKVVVLMTDGDNTISTVKSENHNESPYSGTGYIWQGRVLKKNGAALTTGSIGTRTAALDDRLSKLCSAMKAPGVDIEIYAIRVEDGDSGLLEDCATSADHYYNVRNASELDKVFQDIARQIANLHLAR
jgi:Flp pilus assembly protein TadG